MGFGYQTSCISQMQFHLQGSFRISCLSVFGRARCRLKGRGRGVGLKIFVMTQNHPFPPSTRPLILVNISLGSWTRHFTLTVPLSTQEYKWVYVPANCQGNLTKCWEVTCDGLASHPGVEAILLVASCFGNRDKLRQ